MLQKLKNLKKSVNESNKQKVNEIISDYVKYEMVNSQYRIFFDKCILDGQNPKEAANNLKLLRNKIY